MSELLHSLGINWGVMIAQLVNFTILLLVLAKFVYKPVMRMLDDRKEAIAKAAEHEREIGERLKAMEQEREKTVELARRESGQIIEAAKASAEEVKKKIIEEGNAAVLRMRGEEEKRVAAQKVRLLSEVKKEIGTL